MVIDFNPFFSLPEHMERFLNEAFSGGAQGYRRAPRSGYPPLNISSDDENIYVRCELPGMEINDIELVLDESSLSIKGERKAQEGKYYRQERPVGAFNRLVTINAPVNRDAVKATLKDGLLSITLPKAEETKPRTITIG